MSTRGDVIHGLEDIEQLEAKVYHSVELTLETLRKIVAGTVPTAVFTRLKFDEVGLHPIKHTPLNLIEQLNQTFTCFATLRAARWILDKHPDVFPLRLNLGTASGFDIQSEDGRLVAETFAAVDPRNNDKLNNDIRRIAGVPHRYKYVFYICPGQECHDPRDADPVIVVQLRWPPGGRVTRRWSQASGRSGSASVAAQTVRPGSSR